MLTPTTLIGIHCNSTLRYPVQSLRVAIVSYSCELHLDLLHADFHINYRLGGIEKVAVARSGIVS